MNRVGPSIRATQLNVCYAIVGDDLFTISLSCAERGSDGENAGAACITEVGKCISGLHRDVLFGDEQAAVMSTPDGTQRLT